MRKLIPITLALLLLSCTSTKKMAALEASNKELDGRINELESLLMDTDKDGVADYLDVENNSILGVAVDTKGRMTDINLNNVPDVIERYILENSSDIIFENTSAIGYTTNDLYSLKPTKQKEFDRFFNNNMTLLQCNNKLTAQLKKIDALKAFKYFETNGGFGIITDPKNVDGNPEQYGRVEGKSNFIKKFFGVGDSNQKYQRVYIFLIIKNDLNEELIPNYDYLDKIYSNRVLESKWTNIPNLNLLLNNPRNKFNNQEHTFMMRIYEFKKGVLQAESAFEFIKGDNGYKIDPTVLQLFTTKKVKK